MEIWKKWRLTQLYAGRNPLELDAIHWSHSSGSGRQSSLPRHESNGAKWESMKKGNSPVKLIHYFYMVSAVRTTVLLWQLVVQNSKCRCPILIPQEKNQARAELPHHDSSQCCAYNSLKSWQHSLWCQAYFTGNIFTCTHLDKRIPKTKRLMMSKAGTLL